MRLSRPLRSGPLALSLVSAAALVAALVPAAAPAEGPGRVEASATSAAARTATDPDCVEPDTAAPASARGGIGHGPDHVEVSASDQVRIEQRTAALVGSQSPAQARAARAAATSIPVYVHVMKARGGAGNVTRQQVKRQIAELNDDYSGGESSAAADTAFRFRLAGLDKFTNNAWHQDRDNKTYRAKTRRGGSRALNIWVVDFRYLGIATFPWSYARQPKLDGIRVNFATLPGGRARGYNLGKTVSHEAGHWLGLYHTFQGGCMTKNDLVEDTPAQSSPSSGCPRGRNSCRLPGDDPVHNYMDYSTDACYDQFTPGQGERMFAAFRAFRA